LAELHHSGNPQILVSFVPMRKVSSVYQCG
jgi:hypothetical protein